MTKQTKMETLAIDDALVLEELKKKGIGANADNKTVLPTVETPAQLQPKLKKLSIEITVDQELRLIREAASRQTTPKQYLQDLVNERLSESVGKPYVTGPSFAGNKKVTGPSNSFGVSY